MIFDIFLNNLTSHSFSHCSDEVAITPQLTRPQSLFQRWELPKQLSRAVTLDVAYHFADRIFRWKRKQYMNMVHRYFHLNNFKTIILTNFSNKLFRSFPDFHSLEYLFTIFWTPNQMVACVVNRMTRSFYRHASFISHVAARAYEDKGDLSGPPYNPLGKACIHPRGKPRGTLQRVLLEISMMSPEFHDP